MKSCFGFLWLSNQLICFCTLTKKMYSTDYEYFWASGTKVHEKSYKIIEPYELILSFLQKKSLQSFC